MNTHASCKGLGTSQLYYGKLEWLEPGNECDEGLSHSHTPKLHHLECEEWELKIAGSNTVYNQTVPAFISGWGCERLSRRNGANTGVIYEMQ